MQASGVESTVHRGSNEAKNDRCRPGTPGPTDRGHGPHSAARVVRFDDVILSQQTPRAMLRASTRPTTAGESLEGSHQVKTMPNVAAYLAGVELHVCWPSIRIFSRFGKDPVHSIRACACHHMFPGYPS